MIEDTSGNKYEYRVEEIVPDGYTVMYDGTTIINELIPDEPEDPDEPTPKEVIFSKQNLFGQQLSGATI